MITLGTKGFGRIEHDNEWGYVNRMVDIASMLAASL